ncbi:TOM1-LIKE 6 [Hibiscus trionum]|uniref:TOM1-LIKE 6 n=1 Tax=Hibiscus trionum TaxID=183268 RepID=A0A9W7ITT5_HIBTR|nr:TOM1-LIKE 6 [Hibiscus trionum]
MFSTPGANVVASNSPTTTIPLQHNSFTARGTNGDAWTSSGPMNTAPAAGQKPFIPSYRLFEDLNVLGNADGRHKMTTSSSTSPNLSGNNTQSMVGGRK